MDLHQGQIQGFFNIPVDELTAVHMLVELLHAQAPRGPGRRHRPRLRQARPDLRRAARRAAGDHREAPRRQPRPGRADERHRRGPRASARSSSTTRSTPPARSSRSSARSSARASTEIYACATHGVLSDPAVDRIARLRRCARSSSPTTIPLPAAQAHPQDQDALGRAAHRRGHQAHPPRRVGRRALLERGRAHPGDAPLGGRQRGHASTRATTTTPSAGDDDGEPSPGALLSADHRRPMSLQLHRPTARAASSRARRPTRTGATSCARRAGAATRRRPAARSRTPR